jgi:DNA-binding MarR family transcriptional regulator
VHDLEVARDELDRISDAVAALMRVAHSDRVHAVRLAATGLELSRTELRFLAVIDEIGPLTGTALSSMLHVSQPTASRTLRRLEADGLVRPVTEQHDAREVRYQLTAAGRSTSRRFEARQKEELAMALAHLPRARRRELATLLEEFVAGMYGSAGKRRRVLPASRGHDHDR